MSGTANCCTASAELRADGLASANVAEATAASGLIIESQAAEAAVASLRWRYDEFAPAGIPAHVTVLFPFIDCATLAESDLAEVARIAAGIDAFDYRLETTGWFGEHVVWLAPADPAPFLAVIDAITSAFPDYQPYQGQHAEVIPHLTLGHARPVEELRRAELEVADSLPITDRATAITLMTESFDSPGQWTRRTSFPFRN